MNSYEPTCNSVKKLSVASIRRLPVPPPVRIRGRLPTASSTSIAERRAKLRAPRWPDDGPWTASNSATAAAGEPTSVRCVSEAGEGLRYVGVQFSAANTASKATALERFGVRAQMQPSGPRELGHTGDVAGEEVEIDHQRRSVQAMPRSALVQQMAVKLLIVHRAGPGGPTPIDGLRRHPKTAESGFGFYCF